jgi:hypothetical protein
MNCPIVERPLYDEAWNGVDALLQEGEQVLAEGGTCQKRERV